MAALTIGLDFGTTTIKCVARRYGEGNSLARVLRSPWGGDRWPSLIGRIETGPEAGRLVAFEDCLTPSPSGTRYESNLKLALLCPEDSRAARDIAARWGVSSCRIVATLLLGLAVRQAMIEARRHWSSGRINLVISAPVGPMHPPSQLLAFERAAHAAMDLGHRWTDAVPIDAESALRSAADAWAASVDLPATEDRLSHATPEGYAALKGVESCLGGSRLPDGRVALVDVGGGTTDFALAVPVRDGSAHALGVGSLDIAGDRFDAILAHAASDRAARRIDRREIWSAAGSTSTGLSGDGWRLDSGTIRELLEPHFAELLRQLQQEFDRIEEIEGPSARLHLALTGGATRSGLLHEVMKNAFRIRLETTQELPTGNYGLHENHGHAPLCVALGLSLGIARLEGWRELIPPAVADYLEEPRYCSCRGLLFNCPRCGGSGVISEGERAPRFAVRIDHQRETESLRRCLVCGQQFTVSELGSHLVERHPIGGKPPPSPRSGPQHILVRRNIVHSLIQGNSCPGSSVDERQIASMMTAAWRSCAGELRDADAAKLFLKGTFWLKDEATFLHLPRAICFRMLGLAEDARNSLAMAVASGYPDDPILGSLIVTDSNDGLLRAWERIVS